MTKRCFLIVSIALTLASGCLHAQTKEEHQVVYVASGAIIVMGLALAAVPCDNSAGHEDCFIVANDMGGALAFLGVAMLLVNAATVPEEDAAAPPLPPPSATPPGRTAPEPIVPPHAGALGGLAARASIAARLGNCDAARTAMHAIAREDLEYYQEVVAGEPAIADCLH